MRATRIGIIAFAALLGMGATSPSVAGQAEASMRPTAEPDTGSAASLQARYSELRERLSDNPYGKPLHLVSREGNGVLKGDVYGVVEHPFTLVDRALEKGANWCDILILPFNTKHCEATVSGEREVLTMYVGKKGQEALDRAFRLDFQFRPATRGPDYLKRALRAASGPVGTRDYDITLEATPLDAGRTFIHLSYSYGYGTMSRLAMSAYLNTSGAGKVGFTSDRDESGRAQLVSGMRGVMERNVMRYFLAIEAYFDSLGMPPTAQLSKRLNDWFSASEKYRHQLHEMERWEYLALKLVEARRPRQPS